MTDAELADALDGLQAYDGGAIDSGIHDEALRARCKDELTARQKMPADDGTLRNKAQVFLAGFATWRLEQGTLADVRDLIDWLEGEMSFRV